MPKRIHHDRMVNLIQRALASNGERLATGTVRWPLHGNCHDPYTSTTYSRPHITGQRMFVVKPGGKIPLELIVSTRCRKCPACLKVRKNLWNYRVREETRLSARTWFGTLTMSPSSHYINVMAARKKARATSVDWDDLTEEEQFRRIADASLKEVTRYIKRVRKNSKVPIRYLVVTEKHKSGLPHFHMLIHETALRPVTHAMLAKAWLVGFEKWRLVPFDQPQRALYLCKYLTKSLETRVRASFRYGQQDNGVETKVVLQSIDVLRRSEAE